MIFFWIVWGIDVAIAVVAGGFFLRGLNRATSPRYFTGWLRVFGLLAAALMGGLWLHVTGYTGIAIGLAGIPAMIGLAYGGFLALMLTHKGRWN